MNCPHFHNPIPPTPIPMKFHISNLGKFGTNVPRDLDGYAHTTIQGWLRARMDWGSGSTRSDRLEIARDRAQRTREAVKSAEGDLNEWRIQQ